MDVKVFSLTTLDEGDNIYAVGMSITRHDGEEEAVTFRRDPVSGHSTFAVFQNPEAAYRRFSLLMPLKLVWQEDQDDPDPDPADRPRRPCARPVELR